MQSTFEILFLIGNPGEICRGEKAFPRGNLICCISGTEGRRKLKFGEVGFQVCQNFLSKKVSDLNALLNSSCSIKIIL